jgi:hypothetical protein
MPVAILGLSRNTQWRRCFAQKTAFAIAAADARRSYNWPCNACQSPLLAEETAGKD